MLSTRVKPSVAAAFAQRPVDGEHHAAAVAKRGGLPSQGALGSGGLWGHIGGAQKARGSEVGGEATTSLLDADQVQMGAHDWPAFQNAINSRPSRSR